jgi:leucyl aminopeptidase
VAAGVRRAQATWLARDLTNAPANIATPDWLAGQMAELAEAAGLDAEVWDADKLAEHGLRLVLAVGAGAADPPRMAIVRYDPGEAARGHVALVGKGVTFDSGGLDLKPAAAQETMKTDMAGAAAAFAAVLVGAQAELPLRITAVLPLAVNTVGAAAMRPDDVVTAYDGRSVEIGNTDAEGRLLLADALAYTDQVIAPDVILDIATLTGAARIALGTGIGALFTAEDWLAGVLGEAGDAAGERVWRLPLAQAYRRSVDSTVADTQGLTRGADPAHPFTGAGAIAAALFLQPFTGARTWAHLDIAGPARATADSALQTKGATGFGTALLVRALERLAEDWPAYCPHWPGPGGQAGARTRCGDGWRNRVRGGWGRETRNRHHDPVLG